MSLNSKHINELQGESIKTTHPVFGHAVYFSIHPGRLILLPFRKWFQRKYLGKYQFARFVFSVDLVLITAVLTLAATLFTLILFPPKQFRDNIAFITTVAPHEIITGSSSTLVIDFQNNSQETLKQPQLFLQFPAHFLLQSISYNGSNVPDKQIVLSDIAPGATGSVHVQGVMFGDVNGTQTFTSTLTFTHGTKKQIADKKIATYTFSPKHSALSLSLSLPKRAIGSQPMTGIITYKNTGTIDLPEGRIKPEWPDGFTFTDANVQIQNNAFIIPKIAVGQSGQIVFDGTLSHIQTDLPFLFHPSFVFGKDEYTQEVLSQIIPVLPAQIELSESVENSVLIPGSSATIHVHYKHIGDEPLKNIELSIASKNPFIDARNIHIQKIDSLKPGEQGDVTFTVPIVASVPVTQLTAYEHLQIKTNIIANYTLASNTNELLSTSGPDTLTNLSTPLNFESFARYSTPEGDQIGRGPLPPRVSQKTSYWIFWHIDGTSNEIRAAHLEGILPDNVTFSGKETSSEDGGVSYNEKTRKISWDVPLIPPTLNPQSQVFSVAFEVVLSPIGNQVGKNAPLLTQIQFSGTDGVTNTQLHENKPNITTNLPEDQMARGKGTIK